MPSLRERLSELADRVCEIWETSGLTDDAGDVPPLLRDALAQWVDRLDHLQLGVRKPGVGNIELDALGEQGLRLLTDLARQATRINQPALATEIEQLCLPFALWIGRNGGEIRDLAPVVRALKDLVDRPARPQVKAQLFACCCELVDAASPTCQEHRDGDAHQAWRLLLLNRAIVATHSQNPDLMTAAFDAVAEHLPHDAQQFFTERMEQMAATDYPAQVRDLVRHYFLVHTQRSQLH